MEIYHSYKTFLTRLKMCKLKKNNAAITEDIVKSII